MENKKRLQSQTIGEESVHRCFEEAKMKTLQCSGCVVRKNIIVHLKSFGIAGEERQNVPE
jgi:hypothetical protein